MVTFKTNSPQSCRKPAAWQPLKGDRAELELLQSLNPRKLSLSDLPGGFLEDPTCKAVFIWPDSEPSYFKKALVGEGRKYLLNTITGNCWRWGCLRRWLTVWAKHRLINKLKKKSRSKTCPYRALKAFFIYIREARRLCTCMRPDVCPGKTWEGPKFSSLVDLKAVQRQKVRLRRAKNCTVSIKGKHQRVHTAPKQRLGDFLVPSRDLRKSLSNH